MLYDHYLDPTTWRGHVDEALQIALTNLDSVAAPAGEWMSCSARGGRHGTARGGRPWPGGGFRRKETSTFSGLVGERVAAKGVTVIDDGTLPDRRGSLTIDDEGIVSGKFVFSASEAYLSEDGKIGPAVKGATLIGNGFDVMKRISMIGNDLALDGGIGTCGKDGQGVPVGVGQRLCASTD